MSNEELIAALDDGWKGISGISITPNTCKELLDLLDIKYKEGKQDGYDEGWNAAFKSLN